MLTLRASAPTGEEVGRVGGGGRRLLTSGALRLAIGKGRGTSAIMVGLDFLLGGIHSSMIHITSSIITPTSHMIMINRRHTTITRITIYMNSFAHHNIQARPSNHHLPLTIAKKSSIPSIPIPSKYFQFSIPLRYYRPSSSSSSSSSCVSPGTRT